MQLIGEEIRPNIEYAGIPRPLSLPHASTLTQLQAIEALVSKFAKMQKKCKNAKYKIPAANPPPSWPGRRSSRCRVRPAAL